MKTEALDIKNTKVAKRYATGLLKLGGDFSKELLLAFETINGNFELKAFLTNPVYSKKDKNDVLTSVFASLIDEKILNFLKLLVEANRIDILGAILKSYNDFLDEKRSLLRVKVVSAIEVGKDKKDKILKKLQEKLNAKIAADFEIDENIFGGLIFKIGDKIVDLSISKKFDELSK